jgi:dCMP deaminase
MKPKHIEARIKQCIAIAECSPCPRRKFGALLLDPARNSILMDGYNGGPRGGGDICGGHRCLRDGLLASDVTTHGEDDDCYVKVLGKDVPLEDGRPLYWKDEAESYRHRILEQNPPIKSGTRYEVGCHHAEFNVIANAAARGVATDKAWLIVTGEPCILCAKLLHHAGIAKVICVKGGFLGGDAGPVYLRKHGVEVEYVEGPQDPRSAS